MPIKNPWTACRSPRPAAQVRLLCCPYAGGNATLYRAWDELLPPVIELHVLTLPGRIPRLSEPPLTSVRAIADAVAAALAAEPSTKPLALFGHSMGALVAFEVARELVRLGQPPVHLFVSARQAPQLAWRRRPIHALSDADFLRAIKDLGGTPSAVLEHAELMAILLPALRADFTAIETYEYTPAPPLACPIGIFGGASDRDISNADLLAWADQTKAMALLQVFPGGHFFLDAAAPALVRTITQDLAHAQATG